MPRFRLTNEAIAKTFRRLPRGRKGTPRPTSSPLPCSRS